MSIPFLIIDGYNLLHAAGLARLKYGPGDLQRLRHRLLVMLAGQLRRDEQARCTVVFDAIDAPSGADRHFRHGEMKVLFAEPGHEADELIEELIACHSSPRQLVIVSSDHRLQKAARQRRATSVDSEVFLTQLAARAKSRPAPGESDRHETSGSDSVMSQNTDIAYWLEEFGEIDVDTLAKDDAPDGGTAQVSDPWRQQIDELQRRLSSEQDLDDWLDERPERDR